MIRKTKYENVPAGYEDEDEDNEFSYVEKSAQNLRIRIVPDINIKAGINGTDFDSSLSPEMVNWLDTFHKKYNSYKKTPEIIQNLKQVFMNDSNPMLLALKLFANCPGCNNLKNKNLALFILETICDLCKSLPEISSSCDDNMRVAAFNFIKISGILTLYKSVIEAFELLQIKDILVPKIKELIAEQYIKDATYWAILLKVTNYFSLFDIVFPLILQDKVYLAEEYLDAAKDQQRTTVEFLDKLLDKQQSVHGHCDPIIAEYNYTDVKDSILSFRPMSKLVARLAKKYKIDASHTPNLNYSKARAYIHYLYRKYNEGGMSCESWRELVRDAANTEVLQQELVVNISSYGDFEEATFWAKTFQIPYDDWPSNLRQNHEESNDSNSIENENCENWDTVDSYSVASNMCSSNSSDFIYEKLKSPPIENNDYLKLNISDDCLILVDSRNKFFDMLTLLGEQAVIGFDSEWKPSARQEEAVCLLQLAIPDRIYLIDVKSPELGTEMWKLLGRTIFNNIEILKIGFSVQQDMLMLHKSLPQLNLSLQLNSCYLDLKDLWKRLQYMTGFEFPYQRVSYSGESLSALSEICLGKRLDKSNQFSNWANRPLRKDQIIYAALDAYCLLKIYKVVGDILLRAGLQLDLIVDEITTARNLNLKPRKGPSVSSSSTKCSKNENCDEKQSVDATCLKFICDGMLTGLSKELRKLGIDSIEIVKSDIEFYASLAIKENRYLLSRDSRFLQFSDYLPKNQCIEIPSDTNDEQVVNLIQYFNIAISEKNLFTRCITCNWNEFILARRQDMEMMKYGKVDSSIQSADTTTVWNDPHENMSILKKITDDVVKRKLTWRGSSIRIERLKGHVIQNEETFYICDNCGHCTWNGAHSISNRIREFIDVSNKNLN